MTRLTASEFERACGDRGWRAIAGEVYGWFPADSLRSGAAFVTDLADRGGADRGGTVPDMDLRPGGVRVRLRVEPTAALTGDDLVLAERVSAAASELGISAQPEILQSLAIAIGGSDPRRLMRFWQGVLGHRATGEHILVDPSRRDPAFTFEPTDPSSLRNRVHLDVGRPPEAMPAAEAVAGTVGGGPWQLTRADGDGNEVDLVPGGPLSDDPGHADWRALFGAMVHYPVTSIDEAAQLVNEVATIADELHLPLLVDVRADGVTIDSGKDLWEDDGGVTPGFAELARRVQTAARGLGLSADPVPLRFVQLAIDAVDVAAVRGFWMGALGYASDPREGITDIYDPLRLNPVIMFQQMDAADEARRRQRNRIRLELAVPGDGTARRLEAAVAAGGRVANEAPGRCTIDDPEGNELVLVAAAE